MLVVLVVVLVVVVGNAVVNVAIAAAVVVVDVVFVDDRILEVLVDKKDQRASKRQNFIKILRYRTSKPFFFIPHVISDQKRLLTTKNVIFFIHFIRSNLIPFFLTTTATTEGPISGSHKV